MPIRVRAAGKSLTWRLSVCERRGRYVSTARNEWKKILKFSTLGELWRASGYFWSDKVSACSQVAILRVDPTDPGRASAVVFHSDCQSGREKRGN